jgi:hypothetical protein
MDRIRLNQTFLSSLISSNKTKFKNLMQNSSEENIKSVVEIIVNSHRISKKSKKLRKSLHLTNYFRRKKYLNKLLVTKYLVKKEPVVKDLISSVLTEMIEKSLFCVLSR